VPLQLVSTDEPLMKMMDCWRCVLQSNVIQQNWHCGCTVIPCNSSPESNVYATNSMQPSTKKQELLQSMAAQQKKACEGSGYVACLLGFCLSKLL